MGWFHVQFVEDSDSHKQNLLYNSPASHIDTPFKR